MNPQGPLLVFDFDGVLVDGMEEYWWAARGAALRLLPSIELPEAVPPSFLELRPSIHKGWEMVVLAAELAAGGPDLPGRFHPYAPALARVLSARGWQPEALQHLLESVRSEAIAADRAGWLARHRFYPGVIERLRRLAGEGAEWSVLTTKGRAFAAALLNGAGLTPKALYGHEQGPKPDVLLQLARARPGRPLLFLEDRRPTLELVRATPGLESVRCLLVAWGYLAPGDDEALPAGIRLLPAETFQAPLARWP